MKKNALLLCLTITIYSSLIIGHTTQFIKPHLFKRLIRVAKRKGNRAFFYFVDTFYKDCKYPRAQAFDDLTNAYELYEQHTKVMLEEYKNRSADEDDINIIPKLLEKKADLKTIEQYFLYDKTFWEQHMQYTDEKECLKHDKATSSAEKQQCIYRMQKTQKRAKWFINIICKNNT